jgi:hypothetical protein
MYFVEMTEEDMRRGMDDAYWIQAWTIFVCSVSWYLSRLLD